MNHDGHDRDDHFGGGRTELVRHGDHFDKVPVGGSSPWGTGEQPTALLYATARARQLPTLCPPVLVPDVGSASWPGFVTRFDIWVLCNY